MFRKITIGFDLFMQRYLPDPFLFAVILTLIAFGGALILTPTTPQEMVTYWGDGFFDLFTFAMQMILIYVGGYVMAQTPFFNKVVSSLVDRIKSPLQANVVVAFTSAFLCWINWGLGLVLGAILAKEVAKRMPEADYRLLIAAAYSGFITFHAGLSGSVPLLVATEGHFMQDLIGLVPTSETIFSIWNLVVSATIIIAIPVIFGFMYSTRKNESVIDTSFLKDEPAEETVDRKDMTPAEKLENSKIVTLLIGILGIVYVASYFIRNGFDLNINIVIITFLFIGILLHRTPISFLKSIYEATKGAGGIIIQFPFYAGIMGILVGSGLAVEMSEWLVNISTEATFAFVTFFSAAVTNIFIPSAGGQWSVQAHVLLPAGMEFGIAPAKTVLAFLWGEVWTNLIQPFWALPALAIAGLKARDIMGFCLVVLCVTGVILLGFLLFL